MELIIHTDGGSRGNPGPSAIGVVIYDTNHRILHEHKECIGDATNNIAEYRALIHALTISHRYGDTLSIHMDSELIVKQMQGAYAIKQPHLKTLAHEVKKLEGRYARVTYTYVPRTNMYQQRADALVNEALDA